MMLRTVRALADGQPAVADRRAALSGERIDAHVRDQQLELPSRRNRVGGSQAIFELVDAQPALGGRAAEDLDGLLALAVGCPQLGSLAPLGRRPGRRLWIAHHTGS
jgi:hypothetical protein